MSARQCVCAVFLSTYYVHMYIVWLFTFFYSTFDLLRLCVYVWMDVCMYVLIHILFDSAARWTEACLTTLNYASVTAGRCQAALGLRLGPLCEQGRRLEITCKSLRELLKSHSKCKLSSAPSSNSTCKYLRVCVCVCVPVLQLHCASCAYPLRRSVCVRVCACLGARVCTQNGHTWWFFVHVCVYVCARLLVNRGRGAQHIDIGPYKYTLYLHTKSCLLCVCVRMRRVCSLSTFREVKKGIAWIGQINFTPSPPTPPTPSAQRMERLSASSTVSLWHYALLHIVCMYVHT